MITRLFVYGTLRRGSGNEGSRILAREATFVGRGRMQGRLYRLGEYYGLVPSRDPRSWVYGEVYALDNPVETLARLDDYEGCGPNDPEPREFQRVQGDVVLESGEEDRVWVYVYTGSVRGKQEVMSGACSEEALQHRRTGAGASRRPRHPRR